VANAWREIALEAGEPPAHRGHPASMTGVLAGIVERAGVTKRGSISGIFAVLVDGDDPFEPVSDAVRGLLDGHIMLSRGLAEAGCFPPVDVLRSVSRIMSRVVSPEHVQDAALLRRALASLEKAEDLFAIGAYQRGGDAWLDACVGVRERMQAWLFQDASVAAPLAPLHELAAELRRAAGPPPDQA
jgi:flagellar biosynthesis/type III secretory pathway ATPase